MDEHYFDAYVHNGNSILRGVHYPPIHTGNQNLHTCRKHEDINLITYLWVHLLMVLKSQQASEWVPVTSLIGASWWCARRARKLRC